MDEDGHGCKQLFEQILDEFTQRAFCRLLTLASPPSPGPWLDLPSFTPSQTYRFLYKQFVFQEYFQ